MAHLDQLLEQVLSQAQEEAQSVRNEALAASNQLMADAQQAFFKEADERLKAAQTKAAEEAKRMEEHAQLQARDIQLKARQSLVDRVFDQARDAMIHLPQKGWEALVDRYLEDVSFDSETVLLIPEGRHYEKEGLTVRQDPSLRSGFALSRFGVVEKLDGIESLELERETYSAFVVDKLKELLHE